MALSAADTNKWATLLEKRQPASELEVTAVEYEQTGMNLLQLDAAGSISQDYIFIG